MVALMNENEQYQELTMAGCRYFDSVDICKYRCDWMESRQKTTLPSSVVVKPLVTQVEVFEATEVDVGLFQEGARFCNLNVCRFFIGAYCLSDAICCLITVSGLSC